MTDLVRGITVHELGQFPKLGELLHTAARPNQFDSSEATPRERAGWRHRSLEAVMRHEKADTFHGYDGAPYMTRYLIGERDDGGHIYANCIHRPDMDDLPHDHPWDAMSLVLFGGYSEEVVTMEGDKATRRYSRLLARSTNTIPAGKFHRIVDLHGGGHPTWTLMVTSPYKQRWGFRQWIDGEKVYHKGYQARGVVLQWLRRERLFSVVEAATKLPTTRAEMEYIAARDSELPPGIGAAARSAIEMLQIPPARSPSAPHQS